ncbi:hypothetical protein [Laspinema olomoucense]|nr:MULTISPECIES: hypothetical protein [unclassified Laspinema]MCT7971987.1 hypothetical protein [Laspinema sp. D3d]MCT7990033.1 hypothetical protein [Laspinema sp. D3a]
MVTSVILLITPGKVGDRLIPSFPAFMGKPQINISLYIPTFRYPTN